MLSQAAAPFASFSLLFALAACALLPIRSRLPALPFRSTLLLSLTLLAAPALLLLFAGQHGVSGWTPLLYSLLPLLLAGEGWTPAMIVAPGAVLVLLNGTVPFTPTKLLWALPVLAAVGLHGWALRYAAARLPGRAWPRALAVQLVLAAGVLGCLSFLFDPRPRLSFPMRPALGRAAALALLGTAAPYAGVFFLLNKGQLRPEQIAVSQWLQTLFAVAEGALLLRAHPPSAVYAAAGALLVCIYAVLHRPSAFSA